MRHAWPATLVHGSTRAQVDRRTWGLYWSKRVDCIAMINRRYWFQHQLLVSSRSGRSLCGRIGYRRGIWGTWRSSRYQLTRCKKEDSRSSRKAAYLSCLLRCHSSSPALQNFKVFWRNKRTQLSYIHARFQLFWSEYKPTPETTLTAAARKAPISSSDEVINSALDNDNENIIEEVELENWLRKPIWTSDQYKEGCTAVQYWKQL